MARRQLKSLDDGIRQEVQKIADAEQATIVSFIAPQAVRTSPVTFASASIEEGEMYRLEEIVTQAIEKKSTERLHFVVHTPGGDLFASYKIAYILRSQFKHINAYVPYEAASGGTMLCCAANELYMSEVGSLTSFDPQIRYQEHRVAACAFVRAVDYIRSEFGEMSPEELPSPWQQMANKLDPVIYDEMHTLLFTAITCGSRLLEKSGYTRDNAISIASSLGRNFYTHEFPLFSSEIQELGFNLKRNSDAMKVYGNLVSFHLKQASARHVIEAFYPKLDDARGKQ